MKLSWRLGVPPTPSFLTNGYGGLCLAVVFGLCAVPDGYAKIPFDYWYRVSIQNQPVGWAHEDLKKLPTGSLHYSMVMKLSLSRMAQSVGVNLRVEVDGDSKGRLLRSQYVLDLGNQVMEFRVTWKPGGYRVDRRAGDSRTETLLKSPEPLMSSVLAPVLFLEEGLVAGRKRKLMVVSEELGDITELAIALEAGENPNEFLGILELRGIRTTQVIDQHGEPVRAEVAGLGFTLERVSEDEARATQGTSDLLLGSLITPSRPIPSPRTVEKARFLIRAKSGGSLPAIPGGGCQRVRKTKKGLEVRITSAREGEGCRRDPEPPPVCTELNLFEGAGDESIARKARDLCAGRVVGRAVVQEVRRFVHAHIKEKDFRSLYAPAPEVLRNQSGDCTEHSVLLSALLKSSEVPARWVLGLVYVQGSFWYHEWVEAYLQGRWVALDATFPGDRVDATHIALSRACSMEEFLESSSRVLATLGNLEIEVLDLDQGPKPLTKL